MMELCKKRTTDSKQVSGEKRLAPLKKEKNFPVVEEDSCVELDLGHTWHEVLDENSETESLYIRY